MMESLVSMPAMMLMRDGWVLVLYMSYSMNGGLPPLHTKSISGGERAEQGLHVMLTDIPV